MPPGGLLHFEAFAGKVSGAGNLLLMSLLEMVGKLALALLAGGLVGLERERNDRQAGLRTHMLVCLGSTLFTLVSVGLARQSDGDPGRIAAQIVTGIGFLGAGTIFRSGNAVRGLTTAAGLWTVAAMGVAIGAGGELLQVALIVSLLVFVVNKWLRILENRWLRVNQRVTVTLKRGHDALERVVRELDDRRVEIHRLHWVTDEGAEEGEAMVELSLRMSDPEQLRGLAMSLGDVAGVRAVELR